MSDPNIPSTPPSTQVGTPRSTQRDLEAQLDAYLSKNNVTPQDLNDDGEIDLMEKLHAALQHAQTEPDQPPGSGIGQPECGGGANNGEPSSGNPIDLGAMIDANKDGVISAEELRTYLEDQGVQNVNVDKLQELLGMFDGDGNGQVTTQEFNDGVQRIAEPENQGTANDSTQRQ